MGMYIEGFSAVSLYFKPCPGSTRYNVKGTVLYWARELAPA